MYQLSIIIPIYNVEDYIEECLYSVLNQLPNNVEVICINDGSPDTSMQIVKSIIRSKNSSVQNQFRLIDQDNKGLSGARNTGIEQAQGEYIGFLDSDDKLCPSYFDSILEVISSDKAYDILDFDLINSTDKLYKTGSADLESTFSLMNWFSPARVYHRSLFKNNRFSLDIYYEDIDLTPQLYLEAKNIYHIDKALYWYRYNEQSITRSTNSSSNAKVINSLEFILKKYLDKYNQNNNKYYLVIAIQCFFLLCTAASNRFGLIKAVSYVTKYRSQIKIINIKDLPLSKKYIDKKILAFHRNPLSYIFLYNTYIKLNRRT